MTEHTPPVSHETDAWHLHTAEEGMPQNAHSAKANPLVLVGAWAAITGSVIAIVVVVSIFFNYTSTEIRQRRIETTALAADHLAYREQAQAKLDQTAWIDPTDGVVQIPLDSAMSRVVEHYDED